MCHASLPFQERTILKHIRSPLHATHRVGCNRQRSFRRQNMTRQALGERHSRLTGEEIVVLVAHGVFKRVDISSGEDGAPRGTTCFTGAVFQSEQ